MSLKDRYGYQKNISLVIPTLNEVLNIKEVFSNILSFVDES